MIKRGELIVAQKQQVQADNTDQIKQLISKVENNVDLNKIETLLYRIIDDSERLKLEKAIGLKLKNNERKLSNTDIRHFIKKHGSLLKEKLSGQIPVNLAAVLLIPKITKNYDLAYLSPKLSRQRNVIAYEKVIDGIRFFYFEAIQKSGLVPVTMYKRKVSKTQVIKS
jgi:hypothetical protein